MRSYESFTATSRLYCKTSRLVGNLNSYGHSASRKGRYLAACDLLVSYMPLAPQARPAVEFARVLDPLTAVARRDAALVFSEQSCGRAPVAAHQ